MHQDATVAVARELAAEVVRNFGSVRLRVVGTSMVPAILPDDVVSVRRASLRDIAVGDVVLFELRGRLIIHRVVSTSVPSSSACGEAVLRTRGDRVLYDDAPVTSSELLGRVEWVERGSTKTDAGFRAASGLLARLLRMSDWATFLYIRAALPRRSFFPGRTKCRA